PARNVAQLFTCARTKKEATRTVSVVTAARHTVPAFTRASGSLRRTQEFPSMSSLHFDAFQFAGRRSRPVDAEFTLEGWTSNGIAFEDYERMSSRPSSVPLRHRRWTPVFAASDEKLRDVLLHRAWFYLHGSGKPNSAPADRETINAAATKKAMEIFKTGF